jgi:prolyl oligopeptidase
MIKNDASTPFRLVAFLTLLTLSVNVTSRAGAQSPGAQASPTSATAADQQASDPFLWLEDVHGARATEWVTAENAKTLAVLQQDPRFAAFYAAQVKIGEAKDRIPYPQIIGGRVYNFWQDASHVRGIWRTTSLTDYTRALPAWKTVLDLDELAKTEQKNWVWLGANCNSPSRKRCLISLSDGGEDAVTIREFDLGRGAFVADGFVLPHGKQSATWADADSLLVAREWEPGLMTASGYPFVIKRIARGEPLTSAREIFRGSKTDVSVQSLGLRDGQGHHALFVQRAPSFFETEKFVLTPAGPRKLNMPLKSRFRQLIAGRLLIQLSDSWNTGSATFPSGALVSVDLAAATKDPDHLRPTLFYASGPRQSLQGVAATRDRLIVTVLDNVKGRAFIYTPVAHERWTTRRLRLPDNSSIELAGADQTGSAVFFNLSGYLTPSTLVLADTNTDALVRAKAETPRFDASKDEVEQHFATSKDGTQVPYFIVHPKKMHLDGGNATILYGYGGFSVSLTPGYDPTIGKLWLERGGVYVVANIRGGGEFGPAWHEAGLKTKRQVIYDDFTAVAKDLIARKITSSAHLGIQGGSNGGLLMGVEFTQHPELWNAVDIEVPLLDMLRFEKIQAGASWVGEYGSVANPDEATFLASISPYNNLKSGVKYPEPFIWTTTKDDRVGPQHARKFAAKLASMGIPYFFYEVTEGGHGSGANIKEQSFTAALAMTYFTRKLMK